MKVSSARIAVCAAALAATLVLGALAGSSVAQAQSPEPPTYPVCFSDWSTARAIVNREGLMTIDKLSALAPSQLGGDILRTTLCQDRSHFTYRLVIREPSGLIRSVTVDAHAPFGP